MAIYFADTSFWIGLSIKRDQHHEHAVAWYQFATRTKGKIVTTEAVLLEWLNALSDVRTRQMAAESYLRIRADARIEVVPLKTELIGLAIEFYRDRARQELEPNGLSFLCDHGAARSGGSADYRPRFRTSRP